MAGKAQLASEWVSIADLNNKRPQNSLLTAITYDALITTNQNKKRKTLYCICKCGVKKVVDYYGFLNGDVLSCGCLFLAVHTKYYPVNERIYSLWTHMNRRCYNPSHVSYSRYGAKGVRVCDEWANDYQCFLDWALSNGWQEGLHLDKDIIAEKLELPALLYSPDMCCFVTPKENNNCKSNVRIYPYNGTFMNLADIGRDCGIKRATLYGRLKRGMTIYEATTIKLK